MRRLVCLVLLITTAYMLQAQTQNLPDIKVTGQSDLRAQLFKRVAVLNPMISKGDSLPSFVPSQSYEGRGSKNNSTSKVTGIAQLEINAAFGINSFVSLFPKESDLHSVTHMMRFEAPRTNTISIQNHVSIGGELLPAFPVNMKFDQASVKTQDFKANHFQTKASHHRSRIGIASVALNDFQAQVGISNIRQTVASRDFDRDYIDIYCSSRIEVEDFDSKLLIVSQANSPGIQIAPKLSWETDDVKDIRIHLLADEYRVIPSFEFKYKSPLFDKAYINISNTPKLVANDFASILEKSPWTQFDTNHKLEKIPLNLNAAVEYWYPQTPKFSMRSLRIDNNTSYAVHKPVLAGSGKYGVAALDFNDVIANTSSMEATFWMDGFLLTQSLEFSFAYLASESMRREPYLPILCMNTRGSYSSNAWNYLIEIKQEYFSKDHLGNNQPEAVIGNIGIEYKNNNSVIYAQLSNVFNHRQWSFSEHPSKKRNIYLGLKHRI